MTQKVPDLTDLLRGAQRTAVHLEMRDGYMRDDPLLLRWLGGHRDDPADRTSWWNPWLQLMEETTSRGVDVRRARIVSEPASEYIRFEHEITFRNIASGEQVRWLPRWQATDLALPGNDFWLIDGRTLVVHHFSGEGDVVDHEVTKAPGTVRLCTSAFEAVWERAVPHEDFRLT
ncbi:hypothetical protein GCM10018790_18540 [Kitasatospora xanthocidica]|uniref:DUF6879 family protein n=1 Tax=Kitasatospora xanthocidica TaxID=83382 RepID=UPI00167253C7|nr:DUF6879 family protein [Kitasatospora xanthocidica]GHF41204.1 hypothetical protein GCM10018790_18540 [Kitasatospora xanthocidica]